MLVLLYSATGTSTSNFDSGFLSGITDFDVTNSENDSGDGLFTHNLGAIGIRHLLVGTPPIVDFGPLSAGSSQFLIDSFDGTLSASPSAIPLPPAVLLFGIALIGLVGFSKRRKTAWIGNNYYCETCLCAGLLICSECLKVAEGFP